MFGSPSVCEKRCFLLSQNLGTEFRGSARTRPIAVDAREPCRLFRATVRANARSAAQRGPLQLMPSLQLWFSVRKEESRLLRCQRAFSSLRLEASSEIIRVLAGAGLNEPIGLSLLIDEDIEDLTS